MTRPSFRSGPSSTRRCRRPWAEHSRPADSFRRRLRFEPLEDRALSSAVPVGSEFQVNTYTPNAQMFPEVASDADGDSVVVWQSLGQDGSGWGVYAQRYNNAGVAQGSEFQVNTYTLGHQGGRLPRHSPGGGHGR